MSLFLFDDVLVLCLNLLIHVVLVSQARMLGYGNLIIAVVGDICQYRFI